MFCLLLRNQLKCHSFVRFRFSNHKTLNTVPIFSTPTFHRIHNSVRRGSYYIFSWGWNINCTSRYHRDQCIEFVFVCICQFIIKHLLLYISISISIGSECMHSICFDPHLKCRSHMQHKHYQIGGVSHI